MRKLALVVVVVAVVFGVRAALAGGKTDLWMLSCASDAPDDTEMAQTFVGWMASESTCQATADAMTAYMRGSAKGYAVFVCTPPGDHPR